MEAGSASPRTGRLAGLLTAVAAASSCWLLADHDSCIELHRHRGMSLPPRASVLIVESENILYAFSGLCAAFVLMIVAYPLQPSR